MGTARRRPLVGPSELAGLLGISTRTLRKLVNEGAVPVYLVGRQHRFNPEEVLEALRDDRETVGA